MYYKFCIYFSYQPQVDEYRNMCMEDKAAWDAIIEPAREAGATEEMLKELGEYTREDNIYDDMAKWVSCVYTKGRGGSSGLSAYICKL